MDFMNNWRYHYNMLFLITYQASAVLYFRDHSKIYEVWACSAIFKLKCLDMYNVFLLTDDLILLQFGYRDMVLG